MTINSYSLYGDRWKVIGEVIGGSDRSGVEVIFGNSNNLA